LDGLINRVIFQHCMHCLFGRNTRTFFRSGDAILIFFSCQRDLVLKFLLFFISLAVFCCPSSVLADGLIVEGGIGFYESNNSEAAFLRYQKDSAPLFGFDSYYDLAIASWNGDNHNSAIIITKGLRWGLSERTHFDFEAGGAYLKRTTDNLGTRLQFAFRFALGAKVSKFDIALGYNHFSNGKGIFGWTRSSNLGENFITLQLGYLF
jgi:hypothetical protein